MFMLKIHFSEKMELWEHIYPRTGSLKNKSANTSIHLQDIIFHINDNASFVFFIEPCIRFKFNNVLIIHAQHMMYINDTILNIIYFDYTKRQTSR